MNDPKLIKSLAIAWPTIDHDYPYAVAILSKMGHKPEFPNVPKYLSLWARVNAGKLLGHDVTAWELPLDTEANRLRALAVEYDREKAKHNAAMQAHRKALLAAQDDLDAALSRRLGFPT